MWGEASTWGWRWCCSLLSGDDGVTGLSTSTAARVSIFGSGVWWLGFSQISLRRLPETGEAKPLPDRFRRLHPFRAYAAAGFSRNFATLRKLRRFPQLLMFLLAYFFYNDGTPDGDQPVPAPTPR